ncbi:MAG TPA: transglutaminase-like domain-containing protein [Candidatus Lumbricidophila sp.]|nr:transglutaminase-like domain-containing protein [Candidatus Lumbricidophila sp.]
MTRTRSTLALVAGLALLFAAASLPWWPVYRDSRLIVVCAVGTLLGLTTAALGARFRWPAWRVMATLLGAFLLVGVPLAVPSKAIWGVLPSLEGELDLVAGAVSAWKQLVTIPTPVGHYQALLVPPLMLTLVMSTLAGTVALRTRHRAVAGLAPVVAYAIAIAFGVGSSRLVVLSGVVFAAAMLMWLGYTRSLTRGAGGGGRIGSRMLRLGVLVLAGAVTIGGATVAATGAPIAARQVVRDVLRPPFDPRQSISPLVGFRSAFAPETKARAVLDVTGLPAGVGLRVATLDSYDGIIFSVGGSAGAASSQFVRVPTELDQREPGATSVELTVTSRSYAGLWVPSLGKLRHIEFDGARAGQLTDSFFYNLSTGAQAVSVALQPGDSYRESVSVQASPADLGALNPGPAAGSTWVAAPEELVRLLDRWSPASATPGARLAAMQAGFQRDGYVSHGLTGEPASRAGHGIDRIVELATSSPMIGDGEQYAVAAALLARHLGFPTRVVLGYQPSAAARAAAGTGPITIRSADLTTWIEVHGDDGVWRALDPNPSVRPIPEVPEQTPNTVSRPQSALPPPPQHARSEVRGDTNDRAPTPPEQQPAWIAVLWTVLAWSGLTLLGLSVLCSPFIVLIIAKARRRRLRRRAQTPAQRVDGAWREYLDAAADYGYRFRPGSTRAEQAAVVGGLSALVFAAVADEVDFAPGVASADQAAVAWAQVGQLRRMLASPRSPLERLRARVSVASLRPAQHRTGGTRGRRPQSTAGHQLSTSE